ncbi:hypothetical protein ACLMJK_002736 [Lecanora helva]
MIRLHALLFTFITLVLAREPSLVCSLDVYGQPQLSDGATAAEKLPHVRDDPDGELKEWRIFAEPASFEPRFRPLKNPYKNSMVQLPLIWRYRSARIALLPYADETGKVHSPTVTLDWKSIQEAALSIFRFCLESKHSGGVWVVRDLFRSKLVSVFLYKSGSPFENVMNEYMLAGKGIYPFNPRGKGLEGISLDITSSEATFRGNQTSLAAMTEER